MINKLPLSSLWKVLHVTGARAWPAPGVAGRYLASCDAGGYARRGAGCGRVEKVIVIDSPQWMGGKVVYALPARWGAVVVYPLVSLVPAALLGGRGTVGAILGAVLVVAVTVYAVRIARMAVVVDDGGVTVRNTWRTWHCPWTEVRGFEVPGSPLLPIAVPRMRCTSGRRIRLSALTVARGGLVWGSGGLVGQDWVEQQVVFLTWEMQERRPRRS